MKFQSASVALAAIISGASAQSVVGTPYGFASGVTGGGSAAAAAPSSAEELAEWLSDGEARTILVDQEWDFTGTTATDSGCDRISCSVSGGGQYYLGDLSCGGEDNVAVSSISYDEAGVSPLAVGSNKSIISSNGAGVIKGKGLSLQSEASNVIIQGITITDINPSVVWGGDALDFQGSNDGVWVDHCSFSLTGRMFVVSHYTGSRITLSNNEFDGVTDASATCNGNHYWGLMFIADGDRVTLDRNYFHDQSGRAPKLGADGVSGVFQASNNYFSNMDGHAFDAYEGVTALLEGNVFEAVSQPTTDFSISTIFTVPDSSAAGACESYLGRSCALNSIDDASGDWPSLSDTSALETWSAAEYADYLVAPVDAAEVADLVLANYGPGNLGSASGGGSGGSTPVESTTPTATPTPTPTPSTTPSPPVATTATSEAVAAPVETSTGDVAVSQQWQQCGGIGWTGATGCVSGTSCVAMNDWYSQCVGSATRKLLRRRRNNY